MHEHNCNQFHICIHSNDPDTLYQEMDSPISIDNHQTPRAAPYGQGSGSVTCISDHDRELERSSDQSYPTTRILVHRTYTCCQRVERWLRLVITKIVNMGRMVSINCICDIFSNGSPFMVAICIFTIVATIILLIKYVSWGFVALPFLLCFIKPRVADDMPTDLFYMSNDIYLMVIFIIGIIMAVSFNPWFCFISILALFIQIVLKPTDEEWMK